MDSGVLVYIFTTVYWIIFVACWYVIGERKLRFVARFCFLEDDFPKGPVFHVIRRHTDDQVVFNRCRFVYPICQSWVASPEFTITGRIKSIIRENAIFYGIAGVAGLIGGVVLFFTTADRQFSKTIGLAMTLANNWGLFLLVCLLGVGIVEVPRAYWRRSNVDLQLRYYEYSVGQLYGEYQKNHDKLQTILKQIRYFDTQLHATDPDRKYFESMLAHVPPDYSLVGQGDGGDLEVNYDGLVTLHGRLIECLHDYNAAKTLFHRNVEKAFGVQDIIRMRDRNVKYHVPWTLRKYVTFTTLILPPLYLLTLLDYCYFFF